MQKRSNQQENAVRPRVEAPRRVIHPTMTMNAVPRFNSTFAQFRPPTLTNPHMVQPFHNSAPQIGNLCFTHNPPPVCSSLQNGFQIIYGANSTQSLVPYYPPSNFQEPLTGNTLAKLTILGLVFKGYLNSLPVLNIFVFRIPS